MDTHAFHPSRPGGTVCVAERTRRSSTLDDAMPCGYPATHPIHRAAAPAEPLSHRFERGVFSGRCTVVLPRGICGEDEAHAFHRPANTPAEARTGVSDLAAAALADVADLRRMIVSSVVPVHDDRSRMRELLNLIEYALRNGPR